MAGIRLDWLVQGDLVEIDGARGTVDLIEVELTNVVTVFLEDPDGRILLLKRSDRVGSYPGHWAGVSGFMEGGPALGDALREVREETAIDAASVRVASEGSPLLARGGAQMYAIHPFRFQVGRVEVRIDWEHTESEWVDPTTILQRTTVPKLWEAWSAVRPGAGPPSESSAQR
ncbi:MAG: NUDIX domain-containing protein [Thermoplasmata archaeon]|nr:NUDIX domain-containing protein [Thermoplasmata archaeon]